MQLIKTKCPNCGAELEINAELKQATCNYCGSTFLIDDEVKNLHIDNAEKTGYEFENGRIKANSDNREVVLERFHKIHGSSCLLLFLVMIGFFFIVLSTVWERGLIWGAVFIGFGAFCYYMVPSQSSELTITNKQIVIRAWRTGAELISLPLNTVTSITVDKNVVSIYVAQGKYVLSDVKDAAKFKHLYDSQFNKFPTHTC